MLIHINHCIKRDFFFLIQYCISIEIFYMIITCLYHIRFDSHAYFIVLLNAFTYDFYVGVDFVRFGSYF